MLSEGVTRSDVLSRIFTGDDLVEEVMDLLDALGQNKHMALPISRLVGTIPIQEVRLMGPHLRIRT